MGSLFGIYGGLVEENRDPEALGRLKVRVPAVFGMADEIPTDKLPWALPRGVPFGNSQDSGGFSWLPAVGDTVWVSFLDGEPEKPLWEWGMAPRQTRNNIKLHQYSETQNGVPKRAIISRYGHSLELTPDKVTLTTKEGYQLVLSASNSDAGGEVAIHTPKGQLLRLNDATGTMVIQSLDMAVVSAASVALNAPTSTLVKTGRFTLMCGSTALAINQDGTISLTTSTGATLLIDESGNIAINSAGGASLAIENDRVQLGEAGGTGLVAESGKLSVHAPQCVLNTSAFAVGTGAKYSVLLMTPMAMTWFMSHTHGNGNNGSPTGVPIMPFPPDASSKTMKTT